VKKAFTDIRNLDLSGTLEKHIDPDRSIRDTFAENPFQPTYPTASPVSSEVSTLEEVAVDNPSASEALPEPETAAEPASPAEPEEPLAPAFVPPGLVPPPPPRAATPPIEAPAFIPPEAVLLRQSKA
jgi:sec-independent protein translocase protein TatB